MSIATTTVSETRAAVLEVEQQMSLLARGIRASVRQAATDIDPTLPAFGLKMLRLLARSGPVHASVLAESLDVDRSVISRYSKQLEELGLLETRVDASDGRCRFLAATPEAVTRMDESIENGATQLFQSLASWSTEDLRQFAGYIARLNIATA